MGGGPGVPPHGNFHNRGKTGLMDIFPGKYFLYR
jgi:hypothetical protein